MRLEQIVVGPFQTKAAMRPHHDPHAVSVQQTHEPAR